MIHKNCLFVKIRPGVQEERVKNSAKGNNLDVLALDGDNAILKFKGSVPIQLPSFVSRMMNTLLFTSVSFAGNVFIGKA